RVIGRYSRQTEILSFLGLLVAVLLGTRSLIFIEADWIVLVYLGLSVFAEVFVSMFTLQCWGLYSDCMDSRQSKRLLPLIGAGGTAGAMAGGWLAALLARPLGAENLLLICFFFVSCLGLISARLLTRYLEDEASEPARPDESFWQQTGAIFGQIFSHRLLLQFMLLIMSVKLAMNLVEYQQQVLLQQHFGKDGITAFMGSFLGVTNLLALLFQLLIENRLIQRFGPLFGLLTTPLSISLGAAGFLLAPGLLANTCARGAEQLTHKSIYKTSVNLVYLAFPSELRRRMRVVINGLLEFFAILPFAIITLLLPALPLQGYALSALLAALAALALVWFLRAPYQAQLQAALQNRPLRSDESEADALYSARSYAQLAESNLEGDENHIRFALELMQQRPLPVAADKLESLLVHPAAAIRSLAVATLAGYGGPGQNPALLGLLAREPEPEVRRTTLRALRSWADERDNEALSVWLHDPDLSVQAETLVVLFTRGGIEGILRAGGHLKALMRSQAPDERRAAAYVIGEIGSSYFRKALARLLEAPELLVQLEAIRAAGQSPAPLWVEPLLARLSLRHRPLVEQARLSLQRYPAELLLPQLEAAYSREEALQGAEGEIGLRRELLRVLPAFPGPATLHLLLGWLQRADWRLKLPLLRVLNQVHEETGAGLNQRVIYLEIQALLREAFAIVEILWLLRRQRRGQQGLERLALMSEELELRLRAAYELLFRLLALIFDPERITQACLNFASGEAHYRALSLDLLGQMLGRSLGPPVLNLLEDAPLEKKVHFARAHALLAERHDSDWWDRSLIQDHRLLRQLAAWCRYTEKDQDSLPVQVQHMLDTIYLLKQTPLFANLALEQLEPVARVCRPESWTANQEIFAEGTPGKALYIIRSGSVSVETGGLQLATLGESEVFGEVEVLHAAPHLATVRTLTPCELLVIPRQDFGDLIEDYPAFARGLVEILFERLRAAFERARPQAGTLPG
ncbi:MAG: Npt1/Npt2 family nucleotide transporter, partial [Candidatus Sericytochromatia bacterium]